MPRAPHVVESLILAALTVAGSARADGPVLAAAPATSAGGASAATSPTTTKTLPVATDANGKRIEVVASLPLPPDEESAPVDLSLRTLVGLRGDVTHASTGHTVGAALFALGGEAYGRYGIANSRLGLDASIGGGGGGLEGSLGIAMMFGARWDVIENGGPFARLGGEASLAGNDLLYDSRIVLPEAEIGFQLMPSPDLFELAAYAGPMLDGRADISGDDRHLGAALAYGGRLAIRRSFFFASADLGFTTASHGYDDQALSGRARVCGSLFPLAFCLDGRVLRADEHRDGTTSETAEQIGISVGLGE